jgi:tRNA threonylcarbamoyladenosine biosynthesis protein TsaB
VGLTAAKVLAYAGGRPLVGFDSLEAVARNAPDEALRVAVVADAQRGDVFTTAFARAAAGAPLLRCEPTGVEPAADWAARLVPETFVLGPGLELPRLRGVLPAHVDVLPHGAPGHWPDPNRLPQLAAELWESGRRDEPWFLEPLYLRRSAAEDLWERNAPAPAGRARS